MKTKTTVIYHRADFDGIFCREIAKKFLPGAELIGWDYGDPKIPIPPEGEIYVLDLSPECFDNLPQHTAHIADRLIWIDHHKSAIEKFPPAIPGYRIDGVAACRLAWQWFYHDSIARKVMSDAAYLPTKEDYVERRTLEPLAVRLAGEYDIWDKRDPRAELFQHGLRSRNIDEEKWGDWGLWPLLLTSTHEATALVSDLLISGTYVQYAQTRSNESIIKELGFTFQWEGLTFLACNASRYNSHLFTAGLKPEHDGCFGFKWTGKDWSVSLYGVPGKPEIDLSKIAVKYGGGGHKQACGFRTATLPFWHQSPVQIEDNSETRDILGRPCFTVGALGRRLHELGICKVDTKAEDEQAASLLWMLNLYLQHGQSWREVGAKTLKDEHTAVEMQNSNA